MSTIKITSLLLPTFYHGQMRERNKRLYRRYVMFIAQTTEQQKLLRWLEEQFQPDEIRSVETVAKNAV